VLAWKMASHFVQANLGRTVRMCAGSADLAHDAAAMPEGREPTLTFQTNGDGQRRSGCPIGDLPPNSRCLA
jgi:hypothetical protein